MRYFRVLKRFLRLGFWTRSFSCFSCFGSDQKKLIIPSPYIVLLTETVRRKAWAHWYFTEDHRFPNFLAVFTVVLVKFLTGATRDNEIKLRSQFWNTLPGNSDFRCHRLNRILLLNFPAKSYKINVSFALCTKIKWSCPYRKKHIVMTFGIYIFII